MSHAYVGEKSSETLRRVSTRRYCSIIAVGFLLLSCDVL